MPSGCCEHETPSRHANRRLKEKLGRRERRCRAHSPQGPTAAMQRSREARCIPHEGVELAVLATRADAVRKARQKRAVIRHAAMAFVQPSGIDADYCRLDVPIDDLDRHHPVLNCRSRPGRLLCSVSGRSILGAVVTVMAINQSLICADDRGANDWSRRCCSLSINGERGHESSADRATASAARQFTHPTPMHSCQLGVVLRRLPPALPMAGSLLRL